MGIKRKVVTTKIGFRQALQFVCNLALSSLTYLQHKGNMILKHITLEMHCTHSVSWNCFKLHQVFKIQPKKFFHQHCLWMMICLGTKSYNFHISVKVLNLYFTTNMTILSFLDTFGHIIY